MSLPLKIFICYAREDHQPLEMLRKKLAPLLHSERVQVWYDKEITGGKEWDHEIRFNLKSADIVLLLISDNFFESEYIKSVELRESLDGHERQENIVVPVILRKCFWHKHPEISRLQAFPEEGKPVFDKKHWDDPDDALYNVVEGIIQILDDPDTEARRERKATRLATQKKEAEVAVAHAETERKKQEAAAAEKRRREAEAARQKDLPVMVRVEGGTFQMGDKHGDLWEGCRPVHTVNLSDFEIGKYPVTQKEWTAIMGNNPSRFKGDDLPVENVSWDDCQEFLKKLDEKTGKKYRLPTEAEWEFAARGGGSSRMTKYAGSNDLKEVGWFSENSGSKTHPVGQKKANELGLHDMSGNVWEWCNDWYGDYSASAQTNPTGAASGSYRVSRGGSWFGDALYCRVPYRSSRTPGFRSSDLGFRLASSPQ